MFARRKYLDHVIGDSSVGGGAASTTSPLFVVPPSYVLFSRIHNDIQFSFQFIMSSANEQTHTKRLSSLLRFTTLNISPTVPLRIPPLELNAFHVYLILLVPLLLLRILRRHGLIAPAYERTCSTSEYYCNVILRAF